MEKNAPSKNYIAIDLKSFYASVECVEKGLDPLDANLVVADPERTEKTICLAVSPSLKSHGIPGRARLFEVVEKVKNANAERKIKNNVKEFTGESYFNHELKENPVLKIDYIVAKPRMRLYMDYSAKILDIYYRFVSPEDVHVYSVDEVFIDVTAYLNTYKMTPHELAIKMIKEVLKETGITATAGVGTNLYLCKIAMDIVAKHMDPDADGVRIAELDEMSYRKLLWAHTPITDFWRIGRGISDKLKKYGMYTMGDIAKCSLGKSTDYHNEDLLYKLFGINAELIIDHAWGYESATIKDIKSYVPEENSISLGQVLKCPYNYENARLIVKEMTDLLVLDLVKKNLVTNQIVINLGYDTENAVLPEKAKNTTREIIYDRYGRAVPRGEHGSINLPEYTSSTRLITEYAVRLFDTLMDKNLTLRRLNIVANHVIPEKKAKEKSTDTEEYVQLDLFTDVLAQKNEEKERKEKLEKEKRMQLAAIKIKEKYGKNAILKGMNLEENGTTIERNRQIGGHNA